MTYATVDDLKKRLGDRFSCLYDTDAEAEADIALAESQIDLKIQARYQVPVTVAGLLAVFKVYTLVLCEELIYSRNIKSDENEKIKPRIDGVKKDLEAIANGTLKLNGVPEATSAAGGAVIIESAEPVFTPESLGGY